MRAFGATVVLLLVASATARAEAPEAAPRPEARAPEAAPAPTAGPASTGVVAAVRPPARPAAAAAPAVEEPAARVAQAAPAPVEAPTAGREQPRRGLLAVVRTLVPSSRPAGITETAAKRSAELARGQVCGDPAIQGEVVAAFQDGGGCGIEEPVSVRSIHGVVLTEPALMDCPTAMALRDWTRNAALPAVGRQGGGLVGLQVMGSYTCRPRNNQAGARLSEHGRGHAIDIGGLVLADGSSLSVERDWPNPTLRAVREAACGTFSTVLGPGSDHFHDDHLHLDTARGRGAYCR